MVGVVAAIIPLMQFIFAPIWGGKSDRIGRKKIMLTSIVVNLFSGIFFYYSDYFLLLLLSRICSGIGSANYSTAQAYISDLSPPGIRTRNIGLVSSTFGFGFILGPALGGIIHSELGTRYIGLMILLLCTLNFIFISIFMPESKPRVESKKHFSLPQLIDSIRSVFQSNAGLKKLFILYALFLSAFSMMQISLPLLWDKEYHLNETEMGYMFSYIGACSVVVQALFVGIFSKKLGEKRMVPYGWTLIIPGLLLIAFIPDNSFLWWQLPALAIVSIAYGLFVPACNTLVSRSVSADKQGITLGSLQSFSALAKILGPLLSGFFFVQASSLPFLMAIVVLLLGIPVMRGLIR